MILLLSCCLAQQRSLLVYSSCLKGTVTIGPMAGEELSSRHCDTPFQPVQCKPHGDPGIMVGSEASTPHSAIHLYIHASSPTCSMPDPPIGHHADPAIVLHSRLHQTHHLQERIGQSDLSCGAETTGSWSRQSSGAVWGLNATGAFASETRVRRRSFSRAWLASCARVSPLQACPDVTCLASYANRLDSLGGRCRSLSCAATHRFGLTSQHVFHDR